MSTRTSIEPPSPPPVRRPKLRWRLLLAVIGPGVLAMMGDNDAGGVISYLVTGVTFGVSFFIPLVLMLGGVTYIVQEMSMRLGAVTRTGYARLVFQRFGRGWGYYHLATLTLENVITLITEFIGMTAGLVLLGLPLWAADGLALALLASITVTTGYATKERIALVVSGLNAVFLALVLAVHPHWGHIAIAMWHFPRGFRGSTVIWYAIATVGNALAPWMIFFEGSATIDKGRTASAIRRGRADTLMGAILQVTVAALIIVIGASLHGTLAQITATGPATLIRALDHRYGQWAALLLGFGIFNAGFLAAITISLSSSWTVAEAFGWARSLNQSPRQAPGFYFIYFGSLTLAAAVMLIPGMPFNLLAVIAQVIGGVLIAPILVFLVVFTSDASLMGSYRNAPLVRILGWGVVFLIGGLSLATLWSSFHAWL